MGFVRRLFEWRFRDKRKRRTSITLPLFVGNDGVHYCKILINGIRGGDYPVPPVSRTGVAEITRMYYKDHKSSEMRELIMIFKARGPYKISSLGKIQKTSSFLGVYTNGVSDYIKLGDVEYSGETLESLITLVKGYYRIVVRGDTGFHRGLVLCGLIDRLEYED